MTSRVGTFAALLFWATLTLARADDIKTVTGKEYKNVKISRAEPDGLVIIASYGIIKFRLKTCPPTFSKNIITIRSLLRSFASVRMIRLLSANDKLPRYKNSGRSSRQRL